VPLQPQFNCHLKAIKELVLALSEGMVFDLCPDEPVGRLSVRQLAQLPVLFLRDLDFEPLKSKSVHIEPDIWLRPHVLVTNFEVLSQLVLVNNRSTFSQSFLQRKYIHDPVSIVSLKKSACASEQGSRLQGDLPESLVPALMQLDQVLVDVGCQSESNNSVAVSMHVQILSLAHGLAVLLETGFE